MNFLNRKMFQAGGSVTYADGSTQTFDVNEFAQKIQGLPENELFALKKSADGGQIIFSPELKSILDNVAGRKTIPALEAMDSPGTVSSVMGDYARVAKGIFGPVARGIVSPFVSEEQIERRPGLQALMDYDSPFFGEGEGGFRRAAERGGRTQEELEAIIRGDEIQDFSTQIQEIEAPEPELVSVDTIEEEPTPDAPPIPTTESETLGQMYPPGSVGALEAEQRRLAYLDAIKDVDEFGDPLPESRLEQDDEITKAIQEILPAEVKIDVDKTEADTLLDTQAKFDGTFDIEKPDLLKVDTTVTEEDEETRNTARIPVVPKETTGLFGSDRFLDFIRNVGGQLVATGQMGEGLASGAAKAAEERTARELLKEQEEKKYQRDLAMAVAVQKVKNQGTNTGLKPSELGALQTDVTEISTTVKDYEGTEASIDIMNSAIDLFDKAIEDGVPITGLPGYAVRGVDKLKAFMGATDTNVSDSTKIQNYIDQVKQRSIREILNESGRTISNLDREIVDTVFGQLDLTGDPKEIRKKLANARANLIRNNEDKKRIIEGKYTIIQNPAYQGVGIQAVSPYLESILRIISGQPAEVVTGTGSGVIGSSSVIDIDL